MASYPAIDVDGADADLLAAVVDDFSPTAVEEHGSRVVVFFTDPHQRGLALQATQTAFPSAVVVAREIDDEDWARRSQENLTPVTVGRVTITPPWYVGSAGVGSGANPTSAGAANVPHPITVVITPSMGFGTGHHATTRLCVGALQRIPLEGAAVLDVGTGSGVLAITACALGAETALGIDFDQDAITAAEENLEANPGVAGVRFEVSDVRGASVTAADVVLANLTGGLLVKIASLLLASAKPGGVLILSGILAAERDDVVAAFAHGSALADETREDGWVGLILNRNAGGTV